MPTANERRALWFLAIVALSGSVVRLGRARSRDRDAGAAGAPLERQLQRVDSARARRPPGGPWPAGGGVRPGESAAPRPAARPSKPPEPVDLNHATAQEVERLPGIGPALAARIVAFRDSAGAFASLASLCRVRGVGPALAARVRSMVVFSGASAEGGCDGGAGEDRSRRGRRGPPNTPRL